MLRRQELCIPDEIMKNYYSEMRIPCSKIAGHLFVKFGSVRKIFEYSDDQINLNDRKIC